MKRFFKFYFDLPTLSILALLFIAIYLPGRDLLKTWITNLPEFTKFQDGLIGFVLNIISDIVAATLIGLVVYFIFRIKYKSQLSGKYEAFEIKSNGAGGFHEEKWGELNLAFNIFTNKFRGIMISVDKKVSLKVDAFLEKSIYLRGTYIQEKIDITRRTGAFLLMLDGNGNDIKGKYVFVDPSDVNIKPQSADVLWKRKSKVS